MESRSRSICFVNSDSYPVLNPEYGSHYIGGESVQQTLLAREFVRQGWTVSMVCEDYGQPDGDIIDNIRVWKTYSGNAGIPVVRFFYPRLYRIWRALGKADADYYYQSCAGAMTGFVAKYSQIHGSRMIFRVAHDTDCIPGQQLITLQRDKKIYEYGLRKAGMISAQSDFQKELLENNYGLNSIVMNMVVGIPELPRMMDKDIDVLWVNNLRDFKRPDILCKIAKRMPDISFVMIGGAVSGHEKLHDEIQNTADQIPNLTCVGAVPYHRVNDFFLRAKLLLNTSDSEGFPNSFLQAWVRKIPVISFFDPDTIIHTRRFGISPKSLEGACDAVTTLLHSDELRISMGNKAREYVIRGYSPSEVVKKHISQIDSQFSS